MRVRPLPASEASRPLPHERRECGPYRRAKRAGRYRTSEARAAFQRCEARLGRASDASAAFAEVRSAEARSARLSAPHILQHMPVDVDAAVISSTRLSADYSVVALAAPEVASLARPG